MNATILVIEDNPQNLYLVKFLLEKNGFRVLEAVDGRIGIDLAVNERPDLILLDIQIPVMDGYAVAAELRAIPALAELPIVAVTSYAMVGDRDRILAAGADGYIEKPIDPERFPEQIRQHLPASLGGTGPERK